MIQLWLQKCLRALRALPLPIVAILIAGGCGAPERSNDNVDKSHYERGIAALKMFDFAEAYQELSIAQPEIPQTDPRWVEATYAYALASWHRPPPNPETISQAEGLFRELLDADISDDWKTRVRLSLARIYEVGDYPADVVDMVQARELYRQVQKEYPAREFGYQATLRLAQTYVQELSEESTYQAIELIKAQIERDPKSPWASTAWQYLGDLYNRALSDVPAALTAYEKAESLGFPNESRTDFYLWVMSEWALELGQQEQAVRLRTRIVEEYPRSPYGTMSRDFVRDYARTHPEKNIPTPELKTF